MPSGEFVGVDSFPSSVVTITRGLQRQRAIDVQIASGRGFEKWWQHEVFRGFTRAPWYRRPGPDLDPGVDVAMEPTWLVTDRRLRFPRLENRTSKRLDLVVRAGINGHRGHIAEMKVTRSTSSAAQNALFRDYEALRAVAGWEHVASAWLLVLAVLPLTSPALRQWLVQTGIPAEATRTWAISSQHGPLFLAAVRVG